MHFKAKHNIKLSTKPTEKRRVEVLVGQTRKIIYFFEEQDQGNEVNKLYFPNEAQFQAET